MVTMMLKRRLGITNGGTSVGTLDMEMRQMTLMTKIFFNFALAFISEERRLKVTDLDGHSCSVVSKYW